MLSLSLDLLVLGESYFKGPGAKAFSGACCDKMN